MIKITFTLSSITGSSLKAINLMKVSFDVWEQWVTGHNNIIIYYSKFKKYTFFDIAYFSPIANDTSVRGRHYCVLKLSICLVQLALIIFNSLKSFFILITNTQK